MAYLVTQRTREIGLGITGGMALTRLIWKLLFGVTATDPVTFGRESLLLAGVAALACYIPARRAERVVPMGSLRTEQGCRTITYDSA